MVARMCLALLLVFSIITPAGFCAQANPNQRGEVLLIEHVQELIAAGQLADADRTLKDAIRIYPRSGGLYNLIGIAAAQQNRNSEAESAFLKAVRFSPALVSAYLNLARVQYGEGKQAASADTYRRALQLDNSLTEAHANLSAVLLSEGRYADAERELMVLPKTVKEQDRFRAMECASLAGSGHLQQAEQAAGQISGARNEEDVSLAAVILAKLGQGALVIQMIKPILNNGVSKELRGLLATAYAQTGKLSEARAIFDSLAGEDPNQEQPLVDSARVAYRQNDFEASAGYLIRALEIDRQNPQLQFFFGIICIQMNLPGDALRALRDAVRLDPENAAFNYALGAAILSGEKSGDAALYFRKYIELRPKDPHGHLALAVAEFEALDTDAARRDLTPLTHEASVSAGAHYILGKICSQENDYDGARKHFEKALESDTRNADLETNLAVVDIRQNRLNEARQELDRALALDPGNYLANENLLLLLRKERDPAAAKQAQKFAAVTQKISDEQKLLLRHIDVQRESN